MTKAKEINFINVKKDTNMSDYRLTMVFRFNGKKLVVADTIEKAIELYKKYYLAGGGYSTSLDDCIKSIEVIHGDGNGSFSLENNAIIAKNE